MSYQEIYQGLHKEASAEQVKQLAAMIKKAGMKKQAAVQNALVPISKALVQKGVNTGSGPSRILGAVFKNYGTMNRGNVLPKPDASILSKGLKYALPAAAGVAGGAALGSTGKAGLKEDLAKANANVDKLTAENKQLKAGSGSLWEDIIKALGQWWDRLSKSWNSGKETPAAAPAAAPAPAVKK